MHHVIIRTGFCRYYWTGYNWNVLKKLARCYNRVEATRVAAVVRGEVTSA